MKLPITISVALMALSAIATPALGMRPIGRDLLADVAPAPEPEFLLIELPPSVEGLARGYSDRGSGWRSNDNSYEYNRNDNSYDYHYNNRRDNNYDYNGGGTVVIVGTTAPAGKTLAIDPWKLGQQYPDQTASIGDIITFKWSGTHGVYKIPSGTCPSDFTPSSSNGISVIQAPKADGSAQYKFDSPGTYWFACPLGDGAHCEGGMKVKVVVS